MARTKYIQTVSFKPGDIIWKGEGTKKILILADRIPLSSETNYRVCPLQETHVQRMVTPKELAVLGYYLFGKKKNIVIGEPRKLTKLEKFKRNAKKVRRKA